MDWTPLVDAAITAAATVITICTPLATSYIVAHVRNKRTAALLATATTVGAGIAHDALTTAVAKGAPDWTLAKQVAIGKGLAAARQIAGQVTAADVTAGLSALLAVDPTVPAGKGAVATAVGGDAMAATGAPAGEAISVLTAAETPPDDPNGDPLPTAAEKAAAILAGRSGGAATSPEAFDPAATRSLP